MSQNLRKPMNNTKLKLMSMSEAEMIKDNKKCRDMMSPAINRIKRGLDILVIKIENGGKVIFSQERIGYQGKPFILYKFRSMKESAEADGKPALCCQGDKRLTRVGRFLREHHLDELPQLWNVLKGDMSFVGPRPERKYFVEQIKAINPDYELLYQLRPGLFSPATLYNGYTDNMEKMLRRLRMDLDYLAHHTLWLDTKIIFLTVLSILSGKKF